jgi:hypothetical protein
MRMVVVESMSCELLICMSKPTVGLFEANYHIEPMILET